MKTAAFAGVAAQFALEAQLQGAPAKAPLAFSTLGCPAWTWDQVLSFAEQHGFAAVELRGLQGDLNLPDRPEFSAQQIAKSRRDVEDRGLKIACVSSSTELHHPDETERAKQIADGKRFVEVARGMGAPFVRVFGNKIEAPQDQVIARVAEGMRELGEYAGPRGVTILIESHGDFVHSALLKNVLTKASSPHTALLWDAHHTFVDGGEQPEETVAELGTWIRHTHLKDSVAKAGGERRYVLTGRGQVPVRRQMAALRKIGYAGYCCFEWEKLWHPDLDAPEIAIADYAKIAGEYWREL